MEDEIKTASPGKALLEENSGGKKATTLTCSPATAFFHVSDSSRSVNCWDAQDCLLPAQKPPSLLKALSGRTLSQHIFQPLLTLHLFFPRDSS